jgi:hypothetical protein
MIETIKSALVVLRKGYQLRNVEAWKNAQFATAALTAILAALVTVLRLYGVELPVSDADLASISGAVVAIVGVFLAYLTPATSAKVGLPAKSYAGDSSDAGEGHDFMGG